MISRACFASTNTYLISGCSTKCVLLWKTVEVSQSGSLLNDFKSLRCFNKHIFNIRMQYQVYSTTWKTVEVSQSGPPRRCTLRARTQCPQSDRTCVGPHQWRTGKSSAARHTVRGDATTCQTEANGGETSHQGGRNV